MYKAFNLHHLCEWTDTSSVRFLVHADVQFSSRRLQGHGTVIELGLSGIQIETNARVKLDEQVTLSVKLPYLDRPIDLEEGAVRWIEGRTVGIEFLTMEMLSFQRLVTYLSEVQTRFTLGTALDKRAAA